MLWCAITNAGVVWMCKIEGHMDKTLYKETLEDEQRQTIDFACENLGLRRDQISYSSRTTTPNTL
jgi:hypothetical protein